MLEYLDANDYLEKVQGIVKDHLHGNLKKSDIAKILAYVTLDFIENSYSFDEAVKVIIDRIENLGY